MKNSIFFVTFLCVAVTMLVAQPQKMSYQTVVRDANNELVVNKTIGMKVSVLHDSINGGAVYVETHNATTNSNGLVTIQIGGGTPVVVTNTLADVDWKNRRTFLKVEIDPNGGITYTITGVQEFMTVPYAFIANAATSSTYADTALFLMNAHNSDTAQFAYHSDTANYAVNANYANSAATATSASSANSANYADSTRIANTAISANYATNANHSVYADTATYALNAGHAANSDTALFSMNAGHSNYSDTSVYAYNANVANSANTANSANYADSTRIANTAISANYATNANHSVYADTATYALNAGHAANSDTALFSMNAGHANYSDTSVYAYNANAANSATTANSANYADSTRIANTAISANAALTANYADSARVANSSNTANTANSALTANYADSTRISNSAISANTANYADSTRIANAAISANAALTANYADSARIANSSNTANTANSALTANYADSTRISNSAIAANTANYADSTRIANTAISANNSNNAINAINATHADSSLYANTSGNAINAVNATYADTADFNKLLNRPVGVNKGDILYWETNDNSWHLVPAGNSGEVLAMGSNNVPQWAAISNGGGGNTTIYLPTVTTDTVSNILGTTVTCGGHVSNDGGSVVIARGICISTSPYPTITNSPTFDGVDTGTFTSNIVGLSMGTTYYLRAYATNSIGTAYGAQKKFTTTDACKGATTLTDKNGNIYNTIAFGSQCWMRENLRVTSYASGGISISLLSTSSTSTSTSYAYIYYPNNSTALVNTYGYLYNWAAVMNGASASSSNPSGVQGICPNNWHVPSAAEWQQLIDFLGSQSKYICGDNSATSIGKALSSQFDWATNSNQCAIGNDLTTNNATNFEIMPAGNHYTYTSEYQSAANFWTTTLSPTSTPVYYKLAAGSSGISKLYNRDKYYAFSVRCVKD